MSRGSSATFRGLLRAATAVVILVEGCGGASSTSSPTPRPAPTVAASPSAGTGVSPSAAVSGSPGASTTADACGNTPATASPSAGTGASPSAAVSGSPGASATAAASVTAIATDQVTVGYPHADAALESLLPSTIGGIDLCRFSMALSGYVDSSPGGDKYLYRAWLVKSGKTPDDVNIAVAAGLTEQGNIVVQAIKVPGVDSATLTSRFADAARELGWPVSSRTDLPKPVLVVTDQTSKAAGVLTVVYVYAKSDVLYVVITDDGGLLLQGLASLP
ncbi:MAG: hypothetical protein ABSE70_08200 [Candidatus Limnocylindrales bacterium]